MGSGVMMGHPNRQLNRDYYFIYIKGLSPVPQKYIIIKNKNDE